MAAGPRPGIDFPVAQSNGSLPIATPYRSNFTGNLYYVKPSTDTDYYQFYASYFAQYSDGSTSIYNSITSAYDACVSARGDVMVVCPGTYAENLVIAKQFVTLIAAVKAGYGRPDIAPDTGVALKVTTGQGFAALGMRFASADNSDTVQQNANGFLYDDCVFDGNSNQSSKANLRLVPSATSDSYSASEGKVLNSLIRGGGASGIIMQHALAAGGGEGTTDNEIAGCRFVANTTSDLLSAVNTNGGGAGIYQRLSVRACQFLTVGAAYKYINFAAGAGGDLTANSCLISGNYFADEALTGGTGNQIDLGGQSKAMFTGNYDAAGLVNGTTFNN